MNCEADSEAARVNRYDTAIHHLVTPLPHSPCQLIIQNRSVTSVIKRRVYSAATVQPLQLYLRKKYDWDESTYHSVDEVLFSHIIKKYHQQRITVVKHLHDISPTGHIAHRNNPHLPHSCPACNAPFEDNLHVIRCPHPKAMGYFLIVGAVKIYRHEYFY